MRALCSTATVGATQRGIQGTFISWGELYWNMRGFKRPCLITGFSMFEVVLVYAHLTLRNTHVF